LNLTQLSLSLAHTFTHRYIDNKHPPSSGSMALIDNTMPTSEAGPSSPPRQSTSLDLPSLQPLSHTNAFLSASQFDPDAFLLTRAHIPLEELRGELREYLGQLREELVQLINDDYEEFISLGTGLRGEEERLIRLGKPLGQLGEEIEGVRGMLLEQQIIVQEKLDQRAELREEKVCRPTGRTIRS
jgi:hypothetical protein